MKNAIPSKFKELKDGDKFLYKYITYVKIPMKEIIIETCCNFTRKSPVNAQKTDDSKTCVFFEAEEDVMQIINTDDTK
jgi:hypothetical protein